MTNKLKFKGKTLYRKTVTDNIKSVIASNVSMEGEHWYLHAYKFALALSNKYNVDLIKVCGIIAALSPLKSWDENMRLAETFLSSGYSGHTASQTQKAVDILNYNESEPELFILHTLSGNKIKSFFINIYLPTADFAVTIDRHALAVCFGRNATDKESKGITDNQYKFFESCYMQVAKELNMLPNQVQSITWVQWRLQKNT